LGDEFVILLEALRDIQEAIPQRENLYWGYGIPITIEERGHYIRPLQP
jgi:hypothetical protein